MLVRVLGPVEARASPDGAWIQPPPQQRLVLALLAARLGRPCRADQLADALWGEQAPSHGRRLLQGLVSRLRGVLEPSDRSGSRLRAVPGGWLLDVESDAVDVARFGALARTGVQLAERGHTEQARRRLEDALGLWRGRAFGDLADHPALSAEIARLDEQRFAAREQLLQLRLEAGEHAAIVGDLQELVRLHPLRERLWALLLRALYESGRQADALVAFQQLRDHEVEELGVEPGPDLQELHRAILRQDLPPSPLSSDEGGFAPRVRGRPSGVSWPCRRDLPLVGRDRELAELRRALEHARSGRRRVVLLGGEPGVGKTRLVAELADAASRQGVEVLVGRCTEGAAVPFQPFVEALRLDAEATADEDLADRLGGWAGELARLAPELAERTGQAPPPVSTSPELDQHRLFDAVAGWLAAASAQAPLLLVLEDLHAATRPTLLLLRHLVQMGAQERLLFVATYRDTADAQSADLTEVLAALARHPEIGQTQLDALPSAAVEELVVAGLGEANREAREQARAVYEATAGNALFVQELLASVRADGGPQSESHWHDPGTAGRLRRLIPWSLRQLLEARLQRLESATLRLLEQAAVAGETFEFPAVADAARLAENEALDALDQAIDARLVLTVDARRERYAFGHAVMRYALLDQLNESRRMRLHARLAAALERRHADDPGSVVGELAYHHRAAGAVGEPDKALAFARAAGDGALSQLAYDEAAAHYQTALDLLDARDPQSRGLEQRCDLLTALGEAQQRAGPGVHSETLSEAIRLAVELRDADRVARAAWVGQRGFPRHLFSVDEERVAVLERAVAVIDEHQAGPRAIVLAVLAGELTFARDQSRPRRLSDEALALARRADETVLARVLALRQFTLLNPATVAERLVNTAELVPLVDRLGDPSLRVFARWWRAVAALQAADRPEVDVCVAEACQLAEELGEPFMGCASLMLAANRELMWGELDGVTKLMNRYRELGQLADAVDIEGPYTFHQVWLERESGEVTEPLARLDDDARARHRTVPHWQAVTALLWWEAGRREEAVAVLERHLAEDFESVPFAFIWVHTLCALAELAATAEHAVAAKRLSELLAPFADQIAADAAVCTGPVAHYLGRLAAVLGDWDAAQAYFDQAARIVDGIGAVRWSNHVGLARARLLLTRGAAGDVDTAVELLRSTAAAARREGQTAVEVACAELLRATLAIG